MQVPSIGQGGQLGPSHALLACIQQFDTFEATTIVPSTNHVYAVLGDDGCMLCACGVQGRQLDPA